MPTPSGLVTKQELIDAQLDTAHLGRVVNSKDASGNPINTSTNRTGGVNKTLDALEGEYLEAIRSAGGEPLNGGVWAAGQTFTAYNQFMVYNDVPYKPLSTTTLPYGPTATTPDTNLVGPYVDISANDIINPNLISNSGFEIAGSVANAPDATPRAYNAGDELFKGHFAVGALTGVTYVDGVLNGTGQLYTDITKSQKQQDSTSPFTPSIAGSNGLPKSGASVVDNGASWRVTYDMSDTFSVKLEQNNVATSHNLTPVGKEFLAGAVRRDGGSWSFIDDAGHTPIGFTDVTEPDDFSYQVNYEKTADKIGTIISVIDKELAPYGIHTGAQGGLDNGIFNSYAPCVLYLDGTNSLSASPLWTTQTGPVSMPNAATISITHASRALAVDPPSLSLIDPVAGSHHCSQYQMSWGATVTTITGLDDIQGLCRYDGSNPVISGSPNLNLSASINGGAITITHDDAAGNFIPQLTAFNSPLRPEVQSVTSTTIVIQFRDAAGVVVGAPTTDMQFYFTRSSPVPSAIDSGCRFGVDLGLCKVRNDDVGNVSLNNFWLIGVNTA